MRLHTKSAIVTGAAHGIGLAIAELFCEQGAAVLLADIDASAGEAAASALCTRGFNATFQHVNVADDDQVVSAVRRAAELYYDRIDILVNNASHLSAWHDVVTAPREEWDNCYETTLLGAARFIRAVVPGMISQRSGAIVNIASVQGLVAGRNSAAYTSMKHGLIGLTRSAAYDYAPHNVRVNAICPGAIETRISPPSGSEIYERQIAKTPLGRIGLPREVAQAALFLASDEASYITGVALPVDGGWTAI